MTLRPIHIWTSLVREQQARVVRARLYRRHWVLALAMPPVVSERVWGSKWTFHWGCPFPEHGKEEGIPADEGAEGGKTLPAGMAERWNRKAEMGSILTGIKILTDIWFWLLHLYTNLILASVLSRGCSKWNYWIHGHFEWYIVLCKGILCLYSKKKIISRSSISLIEYGKELLELFY